ncbi:cysteine hydrolase family protein [Rhizobium sp. B21/90]|uniref:cysteine hydrolase family protein n=1 Tax=Rhizobium sp. B21/90 TaxID=2819993 RepID=UPI00214C06ED|nr:cysteine hydrolase [Rhizobium sp. B21/90]
MPWMPRVLPQVLKIVSRYPEQTVFTRFIPPQTAAEAPGMWKDYYEKWSMMTRDHIDAELLQLLPEFDQFAPPARVFDKMVYSPWVDGRLHSHLQGSRVSRLVVSGGDTDVCVLSAILGAIDLGYEILLLSDAICSGADETHDASLKLLGDRFSVQLAIMTTEQFLDGS